MKFSNTSSRLTRFNLYSLIVPLFFITLFCIAVPFLLGLLELDFPGRDLLLGFLSLVAGILIPVLILIILALNDFMVEFVLSLFIISILMMFSAQTYQSYLEKAKITEAIGLMSGTKSKVAEYYSYYGRLPIKTEQFGLKTAGRYTTNIIINNGAITATMRHNDLSLSFRPALAENGLPKVIAYVCGYATPPDGFIVQSDNKTNIPPHYLSSLTCR